VKSLTAGSLMNRQEAIEEVHSNIAKSTLSLSATLYILETALDVDDEEIEDIFSEIMIKIDELIEKVSDI